MLNIMQGEILLQVLEAQSCMNEISLSLLRQKELGVYA